jgi:hypothetical protein
MTDLIQNEIFKRHNIKQENTFVILKDSRPIFVNNNLLDVINFYEKDFNSIINSLTDEFKVITKTEYPNDEKLLFRHNIDLYDKLTYSILKSIDVPLERISYQIFKV